MCDVLCIRFYIVIALVCLAKAHRDIYIQYRANAGFYDSKAAGIAVSVAGIIQQFTFKLVFILLDFIC